MFAPGKASTKSLRVAVMTLSMAEPVKISFSVGQVVIKSLPQKEQITIDAGSGNDRIYAGAGDDLIYGGLGDDTIWTAEGNIIYGGVGQNTITGGSGRDLFVLAADGSNIVNQFEVGKDLLGLSGGLNFEQLTITQGSRNEESFTEVCAAGTSNVLTTLRWVEASSLTSTFFSVV